MKNLSVFIVTAVLMTAYSPGFAARGAEKDTVTVPSTKNVKTSTTKNKIDNDKVIKKTREYIDEMKKKGKINVKDNNWRTNLPIFPDVEFDSKTVYFWHLKTNYGEMKLKFFPDVAPKHVTNFIYLTSLGYFDGLSFHRVIKGFMAQGGDPLGTGGGNPGYRFSGEFSNKVTHDKPGRLSMANGGPGTDGSQFFITFAPAQWLDGKHTIFGEIVEGTDTLHELERRGSTAPAGRTLEPLTIEKAWLSIE